MKLFIFDLDGTVIDSEHRTPRLPDGRVNVDAFLAMKTHRLVFKDTLLPLAKTMRDKFRDPSSTVAVCTSRTMSKADHHYLRFHKLHSHMILHRESQDRDTPDGILKTRLLGPILSQFKSVTMFDDNLEVIDAIRSLGVRVINSTFHNLRLQKTKP